MEWAFDSLCHGRAAYSRSLRYQDTNFQKSKRVGNRTRINEGSVLHCELVLCTMTKNKVQLSVGMRPPFAVERHSPRLEIGAGNK